MDALDHLLEARLRREAWRSATPSTRPRIPFGFTHSGPGRENGRFGIQKFTERLAVKWPAGLRPLASSLFRLVYCGAPRMFAIL
jgi:hypothetical protein